MSRAKCTYPLSVSVFPKLLQMVRGEELLMFAKAVVDFDEIEACAYGGSELYGG